jgi:hypothetical protein
MQKSKVAVLYVVGILLSPNLFAKETKASVNREYQSCMNSAQTSTGANFCASAAIEGYKSLLIGKKRTQFEARSNACIAKYGRPNDLSAAEASYTYDCQYKAVKSLIK